MSLMARIMNLFPMLHFALILASVVSFVVNPGIVCFLAIPVSIYLFPLISFRIHNYVFPLKDGVYNLSATSYTPWWGTYNIQQILNIFPCFEIALRLCPPIFILWLRAWGAKVGKGVYFTPCTTIIDRPMVNIGNNVIFGYKAFMTAHYIGPRDGQHSLVVESISIGDDCFLGAFVRIAPGAKIDNGVFIPVDQTIRPRQHVEGPN